MKFNIELEHEADGRWIAEVLELPGVMAYGRHPSRRRRTSRRSLCGWSPTDSSTGRPAPTCLISRSLRRDQLA